MCPMCEISLVITTPVRIGGKCTGHVFAIVTASGNSELLAPSIEAQSRFSRCSKPSVYVKIKGVSWPDSVSNDILLRETDAAPLSAMI